MLKLNIEERKKREKKDGKIPAVFYGPKEESLPVFVDETEFGRVWKEAGESTILSLTGVGEPKEALIKNVVFHPVSEKPIHIDFYVFESGKTLEIPVPLNFVGVASAVKDKNGILVKVHHEIVVETLPKDIPHQIDVDLSSLTEIDSVITVGDLKMPDGVKPLAENSDVILAISEQKEEKEEPQEKIDMDKIEAEGEKKTEKTDEGETDSEETN